MSNKSTNKVVNKAINRLYGDTSGTLKNQYKNNLLDFAHTVRVMESNDNGFARNPNSSAAGFYQFVNGSLPPAQNRVKRYDSNFPTFNHITDYDKEQQTALFLADLLQKEGTDPYFKSIMETGDNEAASQLYGKYHHTNPDTATLERMDKIFNNAL